MLFPGRNISVFCAVSGCLLDVILASILLVKYVFILEHKSWILPFLFPGNFCSTVLIKFVTLGTVMGVHWLLP